MVLISKEEKEAMVARFPHVLVVRTCKQKSKRHRYYMEESRAAMNYLRELRGEPVPQKQNNYKNNKRKGRWD